MRSHLVVVVVALVAARTFATEDAVTTPAEATHTPATPAATVAPPSSRSTPPVAVQTPVGVAGSQPQGRPFGLGLAIGAPVGVAGKYFVSDANAISFAAGLWSTQYVGGFFDFLTTPAILADGGYGSPFLTLGGGVAIGVGNGPVAGFFFPGFYNALVFGRGPYTVITWGNVAVDVHGTVGLGWAFHAAPVDLFAEFSPSLLLLPTLNLGTRITMGGRWYF